MLPNDYFNYGRHFEIHSLSGSVDIATKMLLEHQLNGLKFESVPNLLVKRIGHVFVTKMPAHSNEPMAASKLQCSIYWIDTSSTRTGLVDFSIHPITRYSNESIN